MTHRLFSILSLLCIIGATAAGQGVFVRVAPQLDLLQEEYDSPWMEYITFDKRSSYGIGGDVGLIIQPRRLAMNIRVSVGLQYQSVKLNAVISDKGMIDEGYVVNSAFEESYEFLTIPVRVELLYASKYARVAPGAFLALNNTFVKRSAGVSRLIDGGSESYDIPVQDYIPSIAAGAFMDIVFSKTVSLEIEGGYTFMLRNVLKDTEADLRFHAINLKAGLIVRLR